MEWRTKNAYSAAKANGTDADDEWQEQLESWARTLSQVTQAEGFAVVRRMEQGGVVVPPYGDIAQVVRREALKARENATDTRHRQKTFRCLTCMDTGIAIAWNPHFVDGYREQFGEIVRTEVDRTEFSSRVFNLDKYDKDCLIPAHEYEPSNWIKQAMEWWRDTEPSCKLLWFACLCDCDCPSQRVLAGERQKFLAGERRSSDGRKAGPPACGCAEFDRKRMPLKTSIPYDDLARWYATHEPNEIYRWEIPQEVS